MSVAVKARKKQRKAIFAVVALILIIFTVAALILSLYTGKAPDVYPDVEGQDKAAYDMQPSFLETTLGIKKNSLDTFSYKIKREIEINADNNKGTALITNPPENNCLMAVEITLEGDDEVIYRSGYLKPNQRIDEIKLSSQLKSGKHDAKVYFCAVDFSSFELLGIIEENILITVE